MAKRNKLPELEKEYGDLHAVIPKLVNTADQKYAAHQLSTSQATISRWLKDNGYCKKVTWVKTTEPPPVTREFDYSDMVAGGFIRVNDQGKPEFTAEGLEHVFGGVS